MNRTSLDDKATTAEATTVEATTVEATTVEAGALNLLRNCVGLSQGQRLLIVREPLALGYYDEAAPLVVARLAHELGAKVESLEVAPVEDPKDLPAALPEAMLRSDHTIFFSRVGDQVRFLDTPGRGSKTMCYALDRGFLGSTFCTLPHELMEEIKRRFEDRLEAARRWRITCPLGTDVHGDLTPLENGAAEPDDFTLKLFPVTTFRPVSCASLSGRVAVAHWLMATASRLYEPFAVLLEAPVFAVIESGRIQDFEGPAEIVRRVRAHYERVSTLFGLDGSLVHSWHAGINPKTFYPRPAAGELERWGGVAFGSPRYLHFHTCGDYAPGEIAWSLFDATVRLDDEVFWQDGRFTFLDCPEIQELLSGQGLPPTALESRDDIGLNPAQSGLNRKQAEIG